MAIWNRTAYGVRPKFVRVIVALNAVVFLFWQFSSQREDSFMARNFLVSWDALAEGRLWTLITSVFSHAAFFHIFLNMFVLLSFGTVMEVVLGGKRFLSFYLIAGIVASLCHALVSLILLGEPGVPALGASGAISGVVLLFALMFPKERILFFGIVPVPAFWGAVIFVGLDAWGLLLQTQGRGFPIGYGSHLGGALFGLLYFLVVVRRGGVRRGLS